MSRGFIKEGDQEEIPRVPPRAYLPEGVPNYVTIEGLDALKEELKNLEAERVKAGDNYIMVNFLDATIKLLVDRINSAVEVDLSKAHKDTVSFGAWVRYNGRVVRIVGVDEADVNKGLISFISPIAKMLIGKKAGDIIELKRTEKIKVEEWQGRDHKALLVACGIRRHTRKNAQAEDGGNIGSIGSEPEVEEAIHKRQQDGEGACLCLYSCFRRESAPHA